MSDIDIVIATSNNIVKNNSSIFFTINSILSQYKQPRKIIIVENTNFIKLQKEINNRYEKRITVLDGTKKDRNISYARNLGASESSSKYILFMDDDVIIGKNNFIESVENVIRNEDFYCGAKRFWTTIDWYKYLSEELPNNHIQQILKYKSFLPKTVDRLTGERIYRDYTFIGNFGAIKKSVFEKVGGFDENYKSWGYQDGDLMMRLCYHNYTYRLMSEDDIFVYHLSHGVDKSQNINSNYNRFIEKQNELGISFNFNNFFCEFTCDNFHIISRK